jgi:membrane protease subunit HflC
MSRSQLVVVIVLLALLVTGSLSVYTVDEREKAILFRLGEIIRTDMAPGLHFKIPFVNNVLKFDSRVLNLDAAPERYLTNEKKNVIVDSFVKWRIADVGRYYTTMGGSEQRAETRISQIIKDALRNEFGKRTIQEVVSGERRQIMDILFVDANKQVKDFGISIVDVRMKRVDLPTEVSASVYKRMEAERARVAKQLRAKGAETAERIRADADRQRTEILADAYRQAEQTRGEGDAKAAATYAKAYKKDPDFYDFYRSLVAYKAAYSSPSDLIIQAPDADFFKYFQHEFPGDNKRVRDGKTSGASKR